MVATRRRQGRHTASRQAIQSISFLSLCSLVRLTGNEGKPRYLLEEFPDGPCIECVGCILPGEIMPHVRQHGCMRILLQEAFLNPRPIKRARTGRFAIGLRPRDTRYLCQRLTDRFIFLASVCWRLINESVLSWQLRCRRTRQAFLVEEFLCEFSFAALPCCWRRLP